MRRPSLRIAMFTIAYPPGYRPSAYGGFIHELATRLAERGHQVSVCAPRVWAESAANEWLDGVFVHRFDYGSRGQRLSDYQRPPLELMPRWLVSACLAGQRLVTHRRCDVIHAHWVVPAGMVARIVARATGAPYVLSAHGSDLMTWSRFPVVRSCARWTVQGASACSYSNEEMQTEYLALGADSRRLVSVYETGVDTSLFHPGADAMRVRAELSVPRDAMAALFIGNYQPIKDPLTLMRGIVACGRRLPDLHLIMVGRGPMADQLRAVVADGGMAERVRWVDHVPHDELPDYFAASDVFILSSLREGLGHVLMEAAACGVPALATDAPGCRRVVVDGETGLLFPVGDWRALADRLESLLRDAALRQRLGAAARQRAETVFRAELQTDAIERLYRLALEGAHDSGLMVGSPCNHPNDARKRSISYTVLR